MKKKILNKYNLFYKPLNFLLKNTFPKYIVQKLLSRLLEKYDIKYINLGGFYPCEDYLGIQLSPVQLYGIPSLPRVTFSINFDSINCQLDLVKKQLTSPSIMLHFNLLNGVPIESNTINGINMSHFLEHFTRKDSLILLKDSYRILKSEGILRISCPDLLTYAKAYVNKDMDFFEQPEIKVACCYEGLSTFGDLFISKAYDNDLSFGHKWFYDLESISLLLKQAGFTQIEQRSIHQSALPNIQSIEPDFRKSESFYIEAIK